MKTLIALLIFASPAAASDGAVEFCGARELIVQEDGSYLFQKRDETSPVVCRPKSGQDTSQRTVRVSCDNGMDAELTYPFDAGLFVINPRFEKPAMGCE